MPRARDICFLPWAWHLLNFESHMCRCFVCIYVQQAVSIPVRVAGWGGVRRDCVPAAARAEPLLSCRLSAGSGQHCGCAGG